MKSISRFATRWGFDSRREPVGRKKGVWEKGVRTSPDTFPTPNHIPADERVVSRWVGFPDRAETRHRAPKSAHDDIHETVFHVDRRQPLEAAFCIDAIHGERLAAEW